METAAITVREHGSAGPPVVVVHGGPGAPGSAAPVARELGRDHRVLEPLQRRSGGEPLTVARHVEDLREVIDTRLRGERPALVGHSWGAMLALAFASAHPGRAASLALVGCGTFDRESREALVAAREARTTRALRRKLKRALGRTRDPGEQLRIVSEALLPVASFELASTDLEVVACDPGGLAESWADMLRLQARGVYPAAFGAIDAPVLMIHGADDPHPGRKIRASLDPHLRNLEYRELARCGHYPWLERHARAEFFAALRAWLERTTGGAGPAG